MTARRSAATRDRLASALVLHPESLRDSLLTLILRVLSVLGAVVYVPSVYGALKDGLHGVAVTDTVAIVTVLGLLAAKRLSFRVRAITLSLVTYAIGVALLIGVGAVSQIYLFGFSFVTVILLGLRAGLASVLLNAVTLLALGGLGYAAPEMALPRWDFGFSEWVVITMNFAAVNSLVTLAIGAIIATLTDALTREIAARADRDRLLAQIQLQIERMPLAYLLTDKRFAFTRWNPAAERMFGFAESEVLGKHPFDVVVPAESQSFVASMLERIRAGSMDAHGEYANRCKDGSTIMCEWHNTPMFDDVGAFAGLLSLAQDITGRRKLEGQLRQAQKMEAVGQLAGGVAHDFNNILSVVLSYSDFVLADLNGDNPARSDVEEIRRAGIRAADLTRRLLMFSRQQVIEPKVLDLNEVLTGVEKMLRRLVGEDVEVTFVSGESLGHVRADPGSVEQVLVNLAVNARDAMPTGGRLTMETANALLDEEYAKTHLGANPGAYVMLSVTDTGSGMDKATLARIFEPFFTTKERGKGTGLGLATVFGIVQQCGGTVWVYSEPGLGTTFKVYLPRVDAATEVPRAQVVPVTLRGSETVLLVEDEDAVRDVARGILQRHGYTVLDTRSAGEALLRSEQYEGPIHLLLTDVVMPLMSGPVLAKRLAPARPRMKVLCMSGYTDDAAVRHGVVDAEFAYLQKPLTVDSLTRKVRDVLDTQPTVEAPGAI